MGRSVQTHGQVEALGFFPAVRRELRLGATQVPGKSWKVQQDLQGLHGIRLSICPEDLGGLKSSSFPPVLRPTSYAFAHHNYNSAVVLYEGSIGSSAAGTCVRWLERWCKTTYVIQHKQT